MQKNIESINNDNTLLDLVDENDHVIGTILRSDYQKLVDEKLGYIRSAEVIILNDEGKAWIPIRTKNSRIAPGGLDYGIGCHVLANETYEEAIAREAMKDHELIIIESNLILQRKLKFPDIPYVGKVYKYYTNETPTYNSKDYSEANWWSPAEILEKIDSGMNAKSSLRDTILSLL